MILIFIIIIVVILYLFKDKIGFGEKKFYAGEPWFTQIKSGKKTIDVRVGEPSKFEELIGKDVTYYHKKDEVEVEIKEVNSYKSLKDLIKKEDYSKIAPHLESDKELLEILSKYFSEERIKEAGGINALKLKIKK